MSKALLCPCEDVTRAEIEHAMDAGYRDLESLKRFTGFGTGMCQGRQCQTAVARLLVERHPEVTPRPFTSRPPASPTELSLWASAPLAASTLAGVPRGLDIATPPDDDGAPLPERAHIVIVGGGIMGLALAYNLALRGLTDVVVIEQSYLCAGASGRNGGGIRALWSTANFIALAKRSIVLMKRFARDMGINIWFREGGYLLLAKTPPVARQLEQNADVQRTHGVETQLLSPAEARDIVPQLTMHDVSLCAYNPNDAVVFPWPFLWGYEKQARQRGVRVLPFTRVEGFEISDRAVRRIRTNRGTIACEAAVIACGAWSPQVARLAGVELPNVPYRHQICSTEPLKPFINPLVSVVDEGLYFSQSMRGELVGGMGDPDEPAGINLRSSARFLSRYAGALLEQLPVLGQVKVLRQWSGPYDTTPDNSPILGKTPGLPNLLQMSGFVGHGFMMAPAVAERMAAWMTTSEPDELFERYTVSRFAEGRTEKENMIIG